MPATKAARNQTLDFAIGLAIVLSVSAVYAQLAHYDFVNPDIMSYFSRRLTQAPRDANFALDYVKTHANTPAERAAVCNALIFKTNVLWVQLDALYHAYVDGHIPPGAFVPNPG